MGRVTYSQASDLLRAFPDPNTPKFFDMDGVLALYDWDAYTTVSRPGIKLYEDEHEHYFRTCTPDPVGISILELFCRYGHRVYLLTAIRSDLPWIRYDKIYWLRKHIPWVDPSTRLIITSGDKVQAATARAKTAGLSKGMMLLDDFNPNLRDWELAGGTAVKYLNGVNTPGTGPAIQFDARVF